MYELMTLQPPFIASNQLALASKIVNDDPEPITGETYSHELQFLVLKMLEKDVSKRPSIDQILSYSGVKLRMERAKLRHKEMRLQERYARLESHWKKTLKKKDTAIVRSQHQIAHAPHTHHI
jgi:serine/threonine protein kinase